MNVLQIKQNMGCCSSKPNTGNKGGNIEANVPGATPINQGMHPRMLQGKSNSIPVVGGQLSAQGTILIDGQGRVRDSVGDFQRAPYSQISSVNPQMIIDGSAGKHGVLSSEETKDMLGVGPLIQQDSPYRKRKSPVYFDLTPSNSNRQNQIYHAVNGTLPPVSKPYSLLSEWQNVVSKHQTLTEEEMVAKLLGLRNRNWVLEQIKYFNELSSQNPNSLESITTSRKIVQLKEHFNWLVWALAQFYFFFNGTSQHYQQFQGGSSASTSKNHSEGGLLSHNASPGLLGGAAGRVVLPKVGSKVWSDGFEYKGIFVRVLPYEDAQFIRNEIKSLKYVQVELLELKHMLGQNTQNQMYMTYGSLAQFSGMNLHQQIILPLITGVSCGGFYLYATPIIHIPKSPMLDTKIDKEFQHVKNIFRSTTTPQSLIYSPSPQPPENYDLNSSYAASSINPRDENLTADSMFKYMPILKNATSRNLVPIYDYEQYPMAGSQVGKDRLPVDPPLFYIMLNLYDILPRLNLDSNPLVTAMRIPSNTSEDVQYHRIPKGADNNYIMEARELRRFIQTGRIGLANNGSNSVLAKTRTNLPDILSHQKNVDLDESELDLQADEYQNFLANDLEFEDKEWKREDDNRILELFQKRTFSKHGWDFLLVSKKQQIIMGASHGPFNMNQLVNQNENKRATNLFSARESQLKGLHQHSSLQGFGEKGHDISFKAQDNQIPQNPIPKQHNNLRPTQDVSPSKKNVMPLEEYNAQADQTLDYSMQQHNQPNQFINTNRLGLFFRQEGRQNIVDGMYDNINDPSNPQHSINKVFGNVLIAAREGKKEFKLHISLCNHTYSTNIEQMFSASIDSVVAVLEQSDKIQNQLSYKELMHRKGLNMRFSWAVLSKLRQNPQRELVMMDILMRIMRKIINEEVKIKSVAKSKVPINTNDPSNVSSNQIEEYYQGGGSGSVDTYKEMLTFYMNTLLKRKILKYKQVFEETLLGLFLQRMSILNLAHALSLKREEYFYLESKDILEDIIDVPAKNPSLFVNTISTYFKVEFKQEFLRQLRQDRYVFIAKSQPVNKSDIKPMSCRTNIQTYFNPKEESYFQLARQIANCSQNQRTQNIQNAQNLNNSGMPKVSGSRQTGGNGTQKQKIKTKTEKDKMTVKRQVPNSQPEQLMASARDSARHIGPLGSQSMIHSNNTSVVIESQEVLNHSKLDQQFIQQQSLLLQQQQHPQIALQQFTNQESMTNRNKEPILHDFRQPKDSLSTIRQYQNMEAIINESPQFAQHGGKPGEETIKMAAGQMSQILDFSKFSKRNNFRPTSPSEMIFPSVLYKLKTQFSSNPMYYFDDASKTVLGGEASNVLSSFYELPTLDLIDNWTIYMESLLKDVYTVNGSEQVLLEALVYQALQIYFYKNGESDELFKVLAKIRDNLFTVTYCAPETIILIQILTGMYFEEKRDQLPVEAEKSYLTAMVCIFQMYGDPRGRGNFTIPYSLFLSWKLSLISLAEDKKLHDSEFAEELFDASLKCLWNHRITYKEQQLAHFINLASSFKQQQQMNSLPTEGAAAAQQVEKSKFELEIEEQETKRHMFDLKKYRAKAFNLTYASGIHKSIAKLFSGGKKSQQQQAAMNVYVTVNHHYNNNKELKGSALKNDRSSTDMFLMSQELFKSRSQVPQARRKNQREGGTVVVDGMLPEDGATNQNILELDPSDIDLDIEDENKNFFIEENFGRNNDSSIGICPFQHWSIYRQQIMQILQQSNMHRANPAQSAYQKQLYRDMVQRFLQKDLFFQWVVKFSPLMYQSGTQWSNVSIREFIFCQNQQMVNSSSSSVVMSNHNLSHHSISQGSGLSLGAGGSSVPTSAKDKKNMHLGSYSQILGKEVGGISKQDMHGILYTMGTDAYGQLGQDAITSQVRDAHSISLKVLYPRMILGLRDELIREICCGHCHTLAVNVHGQMFAWGLNESGQLGLGPDAPPCVRVPALNVHITNVNKVSAGNEHSIAINKSGDLYVWGGGGLTGLGDANVRNLPTKMEFFQSAGLKVQQAVCGGLHTVVLTKEGEVYSWGSTEGGQLGLPLQKIIDLTEGKEQPVMTPQKITGFEGIPIVQVACGEAHSITIAKDGRIFGWGMSNYGQLGLGFSSDSFEPGIGMEKSKVHEPTEITHLKGEHRISKIYCGATFSLFQTEKGDLYGCGMNDLGQLGLDTYMEDIMQIGGGNFGLDKVKRGRHQQASSDVTVPTKVICFQGIALHNIACGENHALAVSGDERNMLWAWGMYRQGQLGLGEVTMKMNPRPVQTLCSSSIQKIACGSMHSLVLIGDTQQISSNYYNGPSNFETLQNHWQSDLRGLGSRIPDKESDDQFQLHQLHQFWSSNQQHNFPFDENEEVAKREYGEAAQDEAEGKVKNPK